MHKKARSNNKSNYSKVQLLILIFFTFLLYANTISNKYALDDELVVYNNEKIQKGISGIAAIFTTPYYSSELNKRSFGYRPIAQSLFAIEYAIFGDNSYVNHSVNIILYILTAILIFFTLRKILIKYNQLLPFVITLLFISHPIHTEVVASLKNREEILSFLFGFVSLNQLFRYYNVKKILNLILGLFSFVIAYLSKESSFVFVFLIPLTLFYFSDFSLKRFLLVFISLISLGVLLRILIANAFPVQYSPVFEENPLMFSGNIMVKLSTAMLTLGFYLKILIFPHPLLFYYGYNMIPVDNFTILSLVILILHISFLILALYGIRRKTLMSYSILFYLIGISMFSNIILTINGIVGERLVYIASLGFVFAFTLLLFKISRIKLSDQKYSKRSFSILVALILVLIVPYSAKTITRNQSWKDHITLYSNDIKYLKKSAKANELISDWYYIHLKDYPVIEKEEILKNIEKYYKQSLSVYPDNAQANNNLGTLYFEEYRNVDSAIVYFDKCLKVDSLYFKAHFNIAQCYSIKKIPEKAQYHYRIYLQNDTTYVDENSKSSLKYLANNNYNEAIKINERLARMIPDSYLPYYNLAKIYLQMGDTIKGVLFAEKSLELNPSNDFSVRMEVLKKVDN